MKFTIVGFIKSEFEADLNNRLDRLLLQKSLSLTEAKAMAVMGLCKVGKGELKEVTVTEGE